MLITAVFLLVSTTVLVLANKLWPEALFGLLLTTLVLVPRNVIAPNDLNWIHVGIADSAPVLTTYYLAILISVVLLAGLQPHSLKSGYAVVPLITISLVATSSRWGGTAKQWAGFLLILSAATAWVVGNALARLTDAQGPGGGTFSSMLLALAFVEFTVSAFQYAGLHVPIYPIAETAADFVTGRVNGTADHPSTVGKVIFLLVVIALPLTRSTRRRVRYRSVATILLLLFPLAAAQGRANFAAVLSLLAIWALLTPQARGVASRTLILLATGITTIASAGIFIARFAADPGGGEREHFLEVALRALPDFLWTGTGLNSYVDRVGPYDALTAQGWPVHNSFLLLLIEGGALAAIAAALPITRTVTNAHQNRRRVDRAGDYSRAILASLPGLCLIAYTGWGLLAKSTLVLAALTYGFAAGCSTNGVEERKIAKAASSQHRRSVPATADGPTG